MNIEAFFLCEAATKQGDKLNVLGAFDTISTQKTLPIKHPSCSIAARIRFDKEEVGVHSVRIIIRDKNNNLVGPKLEGSITVKPTTDSIVTNIVLGITKMKFEQYGKYKFALMIDSKTMASLPLYVKQIKQ